jgi:hypothetical protein
VATKYKTVKLGKQGGDAPVIAKGSSWKGRDRERRPFGDITGRYALRNKNKWRDGQERNKR